VASKGVPVATPAIDSLTAPKPRRATPCPFADDPKKNNAVPRRKYAPKRVFRERHNTRAQLGKTLMDITFLIDEELAE
jgi:hypothetical protein